MLLFSEVSYCFAFPPTMRKGSKFLHILTNTYFLLLSVYLFIHSFIYFDNSYANGYEVVRRGIKKWLVFMIQYQRLWFNCLEGGILSIFFKTSPGNINVKPALIISNIFLAYATWLLPHTRRLPSWCYMKRQKSRETCQVHRAVTNKVCLTPNPVFCPLYPNCALKGDFHRAPMQSIGTEQT